MPVIRKASQLFSMWFTTILVRKEIILESLGPISLTVIARRGVMPSTLMANGVMVFVIFFSDNVLFWFEHYHVDGLRCDAIHMVYDNGAVHFWELAATKVKMLETRLGRPLHLIAESDLNSPKVIKSPEDGGYGFSAQWLDDFHHALYVFLNKDDKDRYYDFGTIQQLAKSFTEGFVHSGEYVKFRKRKHGASSAGVSGDRFIVFNQNHDQIGNRVGGERLCMLVNHERVKLAAAAILFSPYIPMLFMGEEYADNTPFFYFVSHSDPALIKAVREGRKEEFKDFGFDKEPPDAQDENTFLSSKIRWEKRGEHRHRIILDWHRHLIEMRKGLPVLKNFSKENVYVETIGEEGLALYRSTVDKKTIMVCLFNFSEQEMVYQPSREFDGASKVLDSKDEQWMVAEENEIAGHALTLTGNKIYVLPLSMVVYKIEKD